MTLSVKELMNKLASCPGDAIVTIGRTHTNDYVDVDIEVKAGRASDHKSQHAVVIIDIDRHSGIYELDTVLATL